MISSVSLEIFSVVVEEVHLKVSLVVDQARGGRRQRKGSNLRIKLKLSLDEIANGVEKKIKVNRLMRAEGVTFKTCTTCQGSGQVRKVVNTMLGQMVSASTCPTCDGSGQIIEKRPSWC